MKKNMLRGLAAVGILFATMFFVPMQSATTTKEDAEIRNSNVRVPARIQVDKTATVTVKVKNVGDTTWAGNGKYFLKMSIVKGPSGGAVQRDELTPFTELKDEVAPREEHTFSFKIEGPVYTGTYNIEYVMANNNQPFGDRVQATIEVYR